MGGRGPPRPPPAPSLVLSSVTPLLRNVALTTVDAEVYSAIARRLKEQSPVADTMMVTLANGMANSGYIPNDAAFDALTFQVLSSRLKPGCAETVIVNGLFDLLSVPSQ